LLVVVEMAKYGVQILAKLVLVPLILRDLAPLRTVPVSKAIAAWVALVPAVVHFPFAEVGAVALNVESTVAVPSSPPSKPRKLCPHPCEAKAKKARTIAAKPPKRVKG
jgi:hypothetical protein